MDQERLSDAALILLGHGTTLDEDSGAPVFLHAAELRRRRTFAEVREAFWKQEPCLKDVLKQVKVPRVFLVPLFISEGYFSETVIPRALGFTAERGGEWRRVQQCGTHALVYCKPVGTDDSMAAVLLARARGIVEQFPFPRAPEPRETTLFIAGHGTEQNENSRKAVERQADLLRQMGLYAGVHAIFMEEEPRIAEWRKLAATRNVVVVPFFISDGLHAKQDIPVLLGEPENVVQRRLQMGQPAWRNPTERDGKLVWYSSSIGSEPHIADVILSRVREGAGWLDRDVDLPVRSNL